MKVDTFEDFLKKKKAEDQKVDWVDRKNKWIKSVNAFYNDVNKWLYPFTTDKESILKIVPKDMLIKEPYIGTYNLSQLDIIVGNDIVSLIPQGTLILGGYGRMDMKGPIGEISIIQKKWGKWKFIDKLTKEELWDANEETFKSVIQDLVND